jgi:hypothetical protein
VARHSPKRNASAPQAIKAASPQRPARKQTP